VLFNDYPLTSGVRIVTRSYVSFYLGGNGHYTSYPGMANLWFPASDGFGPLDGPILGLPKLYELQADGVSFIKPADGVNALAANALKAMLPGIRPSLSLVNSIIELKDFKSLPRTLLRIKSLTKDLLTGTYKGLRTFPTLFRERKPLRRILGAGSDTYLQAQFNILPLLRDVSGFKQALRTVSDQVDKLVHDEGRRRTRHYSRDLRAQYKDVDETSSTFTWPIPPPTGYPSQMVGVGRKKRQVKYTEALFRSQLDYSYYFSQYQRENAHILGLLDALGVNLNPAIIWNAIPWTFVIDWVVNISSWLDNFKVGNLDPVTLIHDWSWSTTVDRTTTTFQRLHEGTNDQTPFRLTSSCHEVAYKRSTKYLDIGSALSTSGISPKEFMLASALAASRQYRR